MFNLVMLCEMVQVAADIRARNRGFEPGDGFNAKLEEAIGQRVWEVRWGLDTAYLKLSNGVDIAVPFKPLGVQS